MSDDDTLEVLRAEHNELAAGVRSLETLVVARLDAIEREMRAGFQSLKAGLQGVNARYDGLESEVRFGLEKISRLEGRFDGLESRMERITEQVRNLVQQVIAREARQPVADAS